MITLIKNANLYSPEKMGMNDIVVVNDKIECIGKKIEITGVDVEILDVQGKIVTPGFIDQHVHITGGGGQTGYASMVPEVQLSDLIACGTTSVVGLLGTDGFVKELTTLYAKAKALEAEGISAYMLTGFYGLPEKTLMGSVANDMIFIDKVIGCKLAISDDRSSFPTELEILRLVNQVRLGGFTSGKTGTLHIHLGNLPSGISVLMDIARKYPTFIHYLSPTHLIRTEALFNQAIEFGCLGGMIDISTGGTKFDAPYKCVVKAIQSGVPLDKITFSSDGRGGVRKINPVTGEDTYTPAPLDLNYKEMVLLVKEGGMPLEDALRVITSNPARNMKLPAKGRIEKGYDADLCMLDGSLTLTDVMAKGRIMMKDGVIVKKGRYES